MGTPKRRKQFSKNLLRFDSFWGSAQTLLVHHNSGRVHLIRCIRCASRVESCPCQELLVQIVCAVKQRDGQGCGARNSLGHKKMAGPTLRAGNLDFDRIQRQPHGAH